MGRLLRFIIFVPVAALISALSIANRHKVTLYLDPTHNFFADYRIDAPLFIIIFAALMTGIVLGGLASWIAQGKNRKLKKVYKKELDIISQ